MKTESLQAIIPESPRAAFKLALQQALQADLHKLFESPQPEGCRFHALINVGQCPAGVIAFLVAKHGLDYEPLFLTMPEAASADTGPWLMTLPEKPSRALIADLVRDAAAHQALSLLCSPLPGFQLHQHLRSFMNCEMVDGSSGLLRYFDPRIGFELYKTWPEEVRLQFMLPFSCWASWDRGFEPLLIKGKQLRHATAPLTAALLMNVEVTKYLNTINEVDHHIAQLCEINEGHPKPVTGLEDLAPLLQYAIAAQALAFADAHQIYTSTERLFCVDYALLVHPTFYNSPQFIAALDQTSSPIDRLNNTLSLLRPDIAEFWRAERGSILNSFYQHYTEQFHKRHVNSPANHHDHQGQA